MRKQHAMAGSHKHIRFSLWKRLILIPGILLPGGSLAMLAPGQAAYANGSGWSQITLVCRAGDGGNGGIAINGSNGGDGASGGYCSYGTHGGDGGLGGDLGSPGGTGGSVFP